MNIIEFYNKLSKILEMCREKSMTNGDAQYSLKELLSEAEKSKLDVKIADNILTMENLIKYDDERSYEEPSYDEDSYSDEWNG